jgi:hypothetical protein
MRDFPAPIKSIPLTKVVQTNFNIHKFKLKLNYYIMKKILIYILISLLTVLSSCSGKNNEIKVYDYNTKRVVGDIEEINNLDPAENRKILPYILEEDKLDLLGGGMVINLNRDRELINEIEKNFTHFSSILESVRERDFNPTTLVYYSNDTKKTDNICVYEGEKLVYFCRYDYSESHF